jgi:molybdenum cofactor biosynthesis enzyme MoaA
MGKLNNLNKERLNAGDYIYLAQILKNEFDLKCVTLTGGDPFLYTNLYMLVKGLKKLDVEVLALTRGIPVHRWLTKSPDIFDYLDYVYFSIETLNKKEFQKNCRVDKQYLNLGINALKKLTSMGVKTKINCVVDQTWKNNVEKVYDMINFSKKYKVEELRFIEVVDIEKIEEPFLEKILAKVGLDVEIPQKPFNQSELLRKEYTSPTGFNFLVLRCMCSVTLFTGKICCYNQDLYLDPVGRINSCLEWEIDKNPNTTNIKKTVKKRNTQELIRRLNNLKNGLHICPALVNNEKRKKLQAGLQLGSFRN